VRVIADNTHLLSLLEDVATALLTPSHSKGHKVVEVNRLLHRWRQHHDVESLARYQHCFLESLALAACRGLSGESHDLDRSLSSLEVNVNYYRARIPDWQ